MANSFAGKAFALLGPFANFVALLLYAKPTEAVDYKTVTRQVLSKA